MKGVTFGTKHSWDDFGLILTSKEIGLPSVKTETVDVAGMDGSIDLTGILTDSVRYKNRKLTFSFTTIGSQKDFFSVLQSVSAYVHGQKMRVILDDDPSFYYFGRCSINTFKTNKRTATISINVDAKPFKTEINSVGERWIWDTFSFRTGIIHTSEIDVNGSATMNLVNLDKVVSPTVICSAPVDVSFKGATYHIQAGEHKMLGIRLQTGDNELTFRGTAHVEVRYEGGSL